MFLHDCPCLIRGQNSLKGDNVWEGGKRVILYTKATRINGQISPKATQAQLCPPPGYPDCRVGVVFQLNILLSTLAYTKASLHLLI